MPNTIYTVTFERIGRNHSVPPLVTGAWDADDLAAAVHRYARKYLRSRGYDVDLCLAEGKGFIACGMHSGGSFTVSRATADEDAAWNQHLADCKANREAA